MTVKEYLGQGYRLEQRIYLSQLELEQLRELAKTVSAVGYDEHFNASRSTSAPFEKTTHEDYGDGRTGKNDA